MKIKILFFLIFYLVFSNLNAQDINRIYNENGSLRIEFEINKDSIANGKCSIYNENGNLCGSGTYSNGKRYGEWEFYNSDGKIEEKGGHQNGLREGKWINYQYSDEGDLIVTESNYKGGFLDGEINVKKNNKLILKEIYHEGFKVELIKYSDQIYESVFSEVELNEILNFDSVKFKPYFDSITWKLINQIHTWDQNDSLYKYFKTEEYTFYNKEEIPISGKINYLNNVGQTIKTFNYELSTSIIEKSEKYLVQDGSFYMGGILCTPPDLIKGKKEYFFNNSKLLLKYDVKIDEMGMGLIVISSPFQVFYPTGKLFKTGQFSCCEDPAPNKVGLWIKYNDKGKIISKENY